MIGEKNSPTCSIDYRLEYERIKEKYEELHSCYMEMKCDYENMESEFARMRAQLDIVYLIFGQR